MNQKFTPADEIWSLWSLERDEDFQNLMNLLGRLRGRAKIDALDRKKGLIVLRERVGGGRR